MKNKETSKKKNNNKIQSVLLIILLIFVILLAKEVFKKSKYEEVEEHITNHYYSSEHLELAIKNLLGEDADEKENTSEFIADNFDNYVINLILNDINKQESTNISKYNTYLNKTAADEIMNIIESTADIETSEFDDIFYVKIPDFTTGKTYIGLVKYIDKMRDYSNFIIDLRGNTGGNIRELIDILSLFYPEKSIVYVEKSQNETSEYHSENSNPIRFNKIVFLCDESTASSSEVMIFNMKSDFGDKIATVGCKTYGKNFCYSYKQFNDGEMLMFVSGIMCNSKGETFDGNGITPDYTADDNNAIEVAKELFNTNN